MSDINRPGLRAATAIAEYAAFYGHGEPEARVRELVAQGFAEVLRTLDENEIATMALDLLTNPDR